MANCTSKAGSSELKTSGSALINLLSRLKFREAGIIAFLLLLVIVLALICPVKEVNGKRTSTFLNRENLSNVARAFSWTAIMAVGGCIVIISGGIDLSVGSVFGLSIAVAACSMATWGAEHPFICALVGIGVGAACGLANGLIIALARIPAFIVTLGMLSIARGGAYWLTGGRTIKNIPAVFTDFLGRGRLVGIPVPVLVMAAAASAGWFFLTRMKWGRYVFAIGGNEKAARLSGINVTRIKVMVYTIAGMLSGLAGMVHLARFGAASSNDGRGYELDVIAAVVIGGTSLSGGKGSVLGAIIGAAIMGFIRNGLVLLDIQPEMTEPIIGIVIIAAAVLDAHRSALARLFAGGRTRGG